jgi:membrane-bound lytic murein transglycosylase D
MKLYKILFLSFFVYQWSFAVQAYPSMDLDQLQSAANPIPVKDHPALKQAFHRLIDQKTSTADALSKHDLYQYGLLDTFTNHGIPPVLSYGPLSLSNYDVWKVSHDGGSGYWQMRYVTAKKHNVKINSYVDNRRDFKSANAAAVKELKLLYQEFGDWTLAYLALQTGPVEVNKAIRKANGSNEYWSVHPHLLPRHQEVIPNLLAFIYVSQNRDQLQLEVKNLSMAPVDTIYVDRWCTIYQLSSALLLEFETLKNLNPVYKKQVIPQSDIPKPLVIPASAAKRYYELGDSVYTYNALDSTEIKIPEHKVTQVSETKPQTSSSGNELIYYTVRKGDYLGRIADLYDVGISDLRRWNGIRGDQIRVNQRLKIYKPAGVYANYKGINALSAAQKQRLINKD